jgi:hypothetical protein
MPVRTKLKETNLIIGFINSHQRLLAQFKLFPYSPKDLRRYTEGYIATDLGAEAAKPFVQAVCDRVDWSMVRNSIVNH